MSTNELDRLIEQLEEATELPQPESIPDNPDSPARSASGNIRNLKAMGDTKFGALYAEMSEYRTDDPEAWDAIVAERDRRAGSAEEAVERGAVALDEYFGAREVWVNAVNLHALEMTDCFECVLGQLFGSYSKGRRALGLDYSSVNDHGFDSCGRISSGRLTTAWTELLG